MFCHKHPTGQGQNAMTTNSRFTQQFASSIVNTLQCFDRVIFKGYLPFGSDQHLNGFVDGALKIRRMDFLPLLEERSQQLVDHAKQLASDAGAPYQLVQGKHRKEQLVDEVIRERKLSEGLITVLQCQEVCRTVKLFHAQGRPRLGFTQRPQRVLYYYFLDPEFGRICVRLQTWFPYTVQVYVNGHHWLAQQLLHRHLGFCQQDNAFTQLDDPRKAQQLADRFPHLPWVTILERWSRLVNPLLTTHPQLTGKGYYYVIDQAEYSTDILFQSRQALAALYPKLLDHACLHFSAQDILSFLGRRLHSRFDGEVLTDCKKDRWPGARIKHRVKNNWLKMYDKFGLILRIETVINQPREFRVRRQRLRQGRSQMVWCPMNKGVSNFYHYHEVAAASNQRYLDALAVVEPPCTTQAQLDRASKPIRYRHRRRRGLNLLHPDDCRLFFAVLRGEHHLNGFRNRDVAQCLYSAPAKDLPEKRRRTARVSRLLQLLRAHGFIAKVPRCHRYTITRRGHALMSSVIYLRYKAFPKELSDVA
jgi:hypothetical protein